MATIEVKNLNNDTVGSMDLLDEVFAAEINEELLWEAVRQYTAGLRAGTHKTKGRAEVSGSGRKLWKQKGTGRARIGSIRSPLWRHGGTVHGPQPREYSWTMPRKKLKAALRSALAAKFRDNELVIVDQFALDQPKTARLREALDRFAVKGSGAERETKRSAAERQAKHSAAERQAKRSGEDRQTKRSKAERQTEGSEAERLGKRRSALIIDGAVGNRNLELSARNLDRVELIAAHEVHPYHLLRYRHVVATRPAIEKLQNAARPTSRAKAVA